MRSLRRRRARPRSVSEATGTLLIRVPASVVDLARFALGAGQRSGSLPRGYSLESFIVDAAWERGTLLANEKALGMSQACYHLDREPAYLPGEAGRHHLPILIP